MRGLPSGNHDTCIHSIANDFAVFHRSSNDSYLCVVHFDGIVLAVWITTTRWKKLGGNFDQVLDITLVSVPAGIIGARLYHIITTPERFFGPDGDWAEMFRIWNGGLGIWGGVLFGALAAWAWCRHKHYPMALLADAIAPGLLVAQAVGVWATGSTRNCMALRQRFHGV